MPIYGAEQPAFLAQALESLSEQTYPADEVMIVADGPLEPALEGVLTSFVARLPLRIVRKEKCEGLGLALRLGVTACRNELIARMDSDDICLPERLARQVARMESDPELAALGTWIAEFVQDEKHTHSKRCPPVDQQSILRFAKKRNPLNHMTVMFRRSVVLAAGNYEHLPGFEDFDLWSRLLQTGHILANLPECLVLVRTGRGMVARRGGSAYLTAEREMFRRLWQRGFISIFRYCWNLLVRPSVRLLPVPLRSLVYRVFLRNH